MVEEVADHEGLAQKLFKDHVDIVVQQVERASSVVIAEYSKPLEHTVANGQNVLRLKQ